MNDNKFLPGVFFERPKPGRPDFVKGRMSIQADKLIAFLQENKNEAGYVNADLLQSRDGTKLYFSYDDFKPKTKVETDIQYPTEEINPSDVPF